MFHIARDVCRSALILVGAPVTPESIDAMHGVLMAQRDHDIERAREEIASVAALFGARAAIKETARDAEGVA